MAVSAVPGRSAVAPALSDPPARPFPSARLTDEGLVETPHGACYGRERRYPLAALIPEPAALEGLLTSKAVARASGLGWPHNFRWERAVFLDIETTGLGGGAGTYVIMVGLGWMEGDALVVRQYFLQTLGAERALLELVREKIEGGSGLVTFNGRAFDVPLLAGRLARARIRNEVEFLDHLDLLPLARRLYKGRLGGCSLGTLERNLLGLSRAEDVPSWLIPSLYYDYLRRGDSSQLGGIFAHNAQDVAALAVLAARCAALLTDAATPAEDLCALAGLALAAGEFEAAIGPLTRALAGDLPLEERGRALYNLATAYKRLDRWPEAEATWRQILSERGVDKLLAMVELAKYYEHRRREPRRAYRLVVAAEAQLSLILPIDHPRRADLLRRAERLRRKLTRANALA